MDIELAPGKYIIAVSGGVDSVVLLDVLSQSQGAQKYTKLIVAHFDHGIRPDSLQDRLFVENLAKHYNLPFEYERAELGAHASEEAARNARYVFLNRVQKTQGAGALITAHHQDDALETMILNMVRGTNRKGMTSLSDHKTLRRPLLQTPKQTIIRYATTHHLEWREDSTNRDERYLRNHVRRKIIPRLSGEQRQSLRAAINTQHELNSEIDSILATILQAQAVPTELDRCWFIAQSHSVSREVLAAWLRSHGIADFDRNGLERLVIAAKVTVPGKRIDILKGSQIAVQKTHLALMHPER